jgi:site-specific recombinase XerD
MVDLSRVRVVGPLEPFAAGFASELVSQGYAPQPAVQQVQLMAHVSRWLAADGRQVGALDAATAEAFAVSRRAAGYSNLLTVNALVPLLAYLRGLGVTTQPDVVVAGGPVDVLSERFREYLLVERGLSVITARVYVQAVRPFLTGRVSSDGKRVQLRGLRAGHVTGFVVGCCPKQSPSAAKQTTTALRSLLAYLHVTGEIDRSLVGAVPSVAGWRMTGLPKGLEPGQVRALLASCDRDTASGRRAFAILTMLVRLGMRAGEVAALRLDDVNWRAGEVMIRGKGDRCERLPLPADVGEAVSAYLPDRPLVGVNERVLFLRVKAPLGPMTSVAVSDVVAAAARRAHIGTVGAHRLRHTVAVEMLRAGASLPEIGQVLRHSHMSTTAIYAKNDREALREIARPWPGARA